VALHQSPVQTSSEQGCSFFWAIFLFNSCRVIDQDQLNSLWFLTCLLFSFSAAISADFLDLHPHDCADIDLDQGFQMFLR